MSIRVNGRSLRTAATMLGLMATASTLAGCASTGQSSGLVTGSTGSAAVGVSNQPMPGVAATSVQTAQYIPPANVGGGAAAPMNGTPAVSPLGASGGAVASQALPDLPASSPVGSQQAMPAQTSASPLFEDNPVPTVAPGRAPSFAEANTEEPRLAVVPDNAYQHTIETGESLHSIARRYDVSTDAIVRANALTSPDRIFVGQRLVIPGRGDLAGNRATVTQQGQQVAAAGGPVPQSQTNGQDQTQVLQTPDGQAAQMADTGQPAAQPQQQQPVQQAAVQQPTAPLAEPAVSSADNFRWPINGRVITDFAASRGTGINIEAPEGAAIRAAENGTVIYTGSGVEGYGNLILIRHANGYVTAYAHLREITVAKDQVVSRGDTIGTAGMTGSVSRPQLHFEIRRGATPVDPVPMLAG